MRTLHGLVLTPHLAHETQAPSPVSRQQALATAGWHQIAGGHPGSRTQTLKDRVIKKNGPAPGRSSAIRTLPR